MIHGQNLSQVKSIQFNDQSVDLEEIYAVNTKMWYSIPGTVPDEITNKIVVITEKGDTEFPFKVAFPDLIIRGFDFDFGNAGETIVMQGENLLLYDLTTEKGEIKMNGIPVPILSTTEEAVTLKVPDGITDNAIVSVSSGRIKKCTW